jgi:hypothetical protein
LRSYDITGDIGKEAKANLKTVIEDIQKLISRTGEKAESLFGETVMNAVATPESALNIDEKQLATITSTITKLKKSSQNRGSDFEEIEKNLGMIFVNNTGLRSKINTGVQNTINGILGDISQSDEIFPASSESAKSGKSTQNDISPFLKNQKGKYSEGSISLGKVLLAFLCKPLVGSGQYDEIQLIFNKVNQRAGFVRNISLAAFPLDKRALAGDLKELYSKNVSVSISQLIGVIGDKHIGDVSYPAYGYSSAYNEKGEYQKEKVQGMEAQDYVDQQLIKAGIADCNFQQPRLSVVPECVSHKDDNNKTILRIYVTDSSCTPYQTYSDAIASSRSDSAFLVDAIALSTDQKLFKDIYWSDLDPAVAGSLRSSEIKMMVDAGVLNPAASSSKTENIQPSEKYELDLTKLFTTGDPKKVKRFFSESLPIIRDGNSAGMIKNVTVSSLSDPQLATINILKQNESSTDTEGSSREKGLPLIVSPTEVSVDMLGCPIINFGQTAYIDLGTNTTIDNIYACTNLSHKISAGEFTTTAKFTLNVGAYGVYNSSKRSVELTQQMIKQMFQNENIETLDNLTTTPLSKLSTRVWGTDFCKSVASKNVISEYAKIRKRKKIPVSIRVWSTIEASQFFKSKLDDYTEIVVQDESMTVSDIFNAIKTNIDVTCIDFPCPENFKSNGSPVIARGDEYSRLLNSTTVLNVDITKFCEGLQ